MHLRKIQVWRSFSEEMCFAFGFACMSDVPNPELTGWTGFMFKQKQRANTHKHLWRHTVHAHIFKCTEDSLLPFLAQTHSKVFGLVTSMSRKYTHSPSLLERVQCVLSFLVHTYKDKHTLTHSCPLSQWQGHFGGELWICNVHGQMFILKQMVVAKSFN